MAVEATPVGDAGRGILDQLAPALSMFGLDPDALGALFDGQAIEPDTINDLCEAVDELRATMAAELAELRDALAPVIELAEAVKANAPKLRKFGVTL